MPTESGLINEMEAPLFLEFDGKTRFAFSAESLFPCIGSRTQVLHPSNLNDKPCHSEPRRRRGTSQLQVVPNSCRKACIAFERSFGALRQPQDDHLASALPIYRDSSKSDAKDVRSLRYISRPSIVRLWKSLHTRARQRRLRTGLWRE